MTGHCTVHATHRGTCPACQQADAAQSKLQLEQATAAGKAWAAKAA